MIIVKLKHYQFGYQNRYIKKSADFIFYLEKYIYWIITEKKKLKISISSGALSKFDGSTHSAKSKN